MTRQAKLLIDLNSKTPIPWQEKSWILLDMDGTLIETRMGKMAHPFLLALLIRRLRKYGFPWKNLYSTFRSCLDGFTCGHQEISNESFMIKTLSDKLGIPIDDVRGLFTSFRNTEYLGCCSLLLRPRKGALELVRRLQSSGFRIALATQPMYGKQEIAMRLWGGGLHIDDFDYICTWQNFRHLKPHPAFFTSLLDELNCSPKDCLMIGDSMKHDGSALGLGIDTLIIPKSIDLSEVAVKIPFAAARVENSTKSREFTREIHAA